MATTRQIDVAELASVIRRQGKVTHPMDVTMKGIVVGRMVPPGEVSEAEKEEILRKGWAFVRRARAHNQGVPERDIAKVVNAAVNRVRSRK